MALEMQVQFLLEAGQRRHAALASMKLAALERANPAVAALRLPQG